MDQDERQRKLEAGRAKLAHFRQRRAKSESSSSQKKTPKRKGQTVQTNDWSAQDCHLEEPETDDCHGEINKEYSEASLRPDGTESSAPEVLQCSREDDETDASARDPEEDLCSESELPDQVEDELAEMIIVAHTDKEQLKRLQAAVEKRNEIISQLSENLQVALQSRDQVQLEAQQLTGQIQSLQQQLQQAKEYLRSKSQGCVDLTQAVQNQLHVQLEESQQMTKEQQCLLAQKETEITDLQQKLCVMEKSLSQLQHAFTQRSGDQKDLRLDQHGSLDLSTVSPLFPDNSPDSDSEALMQSLRAELEEERKNSQRAQEQVEAFQKRVQSLESEKTLMEAHLAAVNETQAQEAQKYKAEKDKLNQEMARLDNLVKELQNRLHEEEETGRHMRSKYEADISNYDLRLQTLEEERELNVAQLTEAHEAALSRLQKEHSDEIHRIQELLNQAQSQHTDSHYNVSKNFGADVPWKKVSKELYNEETATESAGRDDYSFDVPAGGFQDDLMERYLASEGPQESSLIEGSMEECSLMESSETSRFELDSEVIFHTSDVPNNVTSDGDKSEPRLSVVHSIEVPQPDEMSFTNAQWQNSTSVVEELNDSAGTVDLAKELLIQQCRDLSEQLEERERQLEVLQEEVQHSAEEVEEARERWSKASEELEEAKWELEMEREKRIQYEEVISQKMHEEDNLKNILSHLQIQKRLQLQDNERLMPDNTDSNKTSIFLSIEELLKELKEENAQLVLQLKCQEQLVKDVHEQKPALDSINSELSSLQAQRDEFLLQLEQQRGKNQATSVLLGQRTLQVDQANRELQQLKAEVEEKVGRLQNLEKEKTDLESKLMCLKENLNNMEEEKATLERRLQALEDQAKSMEVVLESELKNFEHQLESKDAELKEVKEVKEKAEEEYMEKESALMKELITVKQDLEERQKQHEEEKRILEKKHQKEAKYLNVRFEREHSEQSTHLEDEQKRQISLIKQVYEREHERELTQLAAQHSEEICILKDELSRELQDGLEAAHQAELLQTQSQHNLELEALRLSLTNLHTAQLELSQTNMQKDKEVALSELQTMLREKWAQESAMLQTRQQFELERIRGQSQEQEQRNQRLHQQEIDNLNWEWEKRVLEEKSLVEQLQARKLEDLKAELLLEAEKVKTELQSQLNDAHHKLSETQAAFTEAEVALSETQGRLEELQSSRDQDVKNLEKELKQALTDRDAAARAVEELVACHKAALQEKQEHSRALEQRGKELKQEVDRLQSEKEELKTNSEQEISNLWSQLESMRTNRQDLGGISHQEEQKQLEEKLTLQRDAALDQQRERHAVELQAQKTLLDERAAQLERLEKDCQELKIHHWEELESLRTNHKMALETLEMELTNKHKVELDRLEAVLQETNLAQLEAQEAELQARHKREREELEERLLANMDTLESTFLKEIQAVRDEKERELRDLVEHYIGEIERVRKVEQTIREDLRSELAKVHMDKFSAMAAELNQAHQAEISEAVSSQRAALEDEHRSTLEALQQQVVALEEQHSAALLEITDLAAAKEKQHEQQLDVLATQYQQQLQELRGVSARELEALRRELEEDASRQRLHFLEEAELLKCKSEELLQHKIAQLKEESDQDKAAALEELERTLRQKHEQTELAYSDKMSQLNVQLQQLDTVVSQLRAEVSGLQVELEGKRAEMDTLETLLQRRDRENQEGDNLLAMLRADLNTASQQRQDLQTARDKLQRMLIEMLRITMATEEHINHKLGACVSGGQAGDKTPNSMTASSSRDSRETGEVIGVEGGADCSVWSSAVDEGLEMSQRLCESVFSGPEGEMEAEGEELMLGACTRLRTAVDKLLELLSESSQQLEQMCGLQAVLNERFRDGGEAGASLLFQNSQLLEQLDHEASLKSQLQLELHKAEGLMEGYVAEKASLEEALQQKETQQQRLAEELESTRIHLQQLSENHTLLLRQREALTAGLGDTEKALLVEAERLGQECVEVQRQAEKDCGGLASRLQMLEQALEEQESQQIEDLVLQVESLQALIKDKIEDYSVLLSAKEQCQRDVEERNEEIEKLAARIRELEQALLSCAESSRTVTQLEQELQKARKNLQELTQDKEALQQQQYANKLQISALQSKLDETRHRFPDMTPEPNLREQLEATQQDLQTKEQQVEFLSERISELEKDLVVREEGFGQLTLQLELKNRESRATEDQLHAHITHLQETVDALTRRLEEGSDESILQLPSALLEEKNLEIDHLNQQILQLQQELDMTNDNKTLEEKQFEIEELRSLVERLRCDQERLRQAKEEETEQLHEVINKLQEELSQLDPNHHEVSDLNTDSPESSDFPWNPHPRQQRAPEESLCQELSSHTLQSSRARLQELQIELERAAGEKDSLQRLLLSQEEQYGSQVETLGRSLGEERGKVVVLEQEANELKLQLEEKRTEAERLADRVEVLEDTEQAHQSRLRESELQLRRVEERRDKVQQELGRLQEEVKNQCVEKELLENQISKLQSNEEKYQNELAALRSKLKEHEESAQVSKATIIALEASKKELFVEREALRKREGCLQEEIERLKQEVTSKTNYIKELCEQQEETVAKQGEAQKKGLTCAEETLAKAETALREREEQLIHLRAEHDALRAELASVKEGLSTSTERAEKLQEEGQTKDRALADLEVHNQHLKAELRSLQDDLAVQEEELAYQQQELEQLRQRCNLQDHHPKHGHRFLEGLSRDPSLSASLSSPEILRRLDCSEERPSHLQVSHLSELSALHNATLELHSKPSPMEREKERPHARQTFIPPSEEVPPSTHTASSCSLTVSEHLSVLDSLDANKVDELDNSDVTPSRSPLGSTSPVSVPEWVSDGYGSNVSSELEAMLKLELENTERLDAHFVEYLRCRGMSPGEKTDSAAGSMHESHEALTPELQAMLKRVYQESCRILSLSHRPAPSGQSRPDSEPAPPHSWQRERRALQETILSLRELLCRMADREPRTDQGDVDWRRELLQVVRSVFDSEREWLHSQLQAFMATTTQMDLTPLLDQLKKLFQKQEEQQWRSLEQLFNADRHSLLAEVRSLHAQLHASTQQSQEQLRQLQDSLDTAKEQGMEVQHQLRRDAEELELQLQQEQTVSHDLRTSLKAEKSRGLEQQRQLEAELKAVSVLKAELEETRLQLQSTYKNLDELKSHNQKLRQKLENVEAEHQACLQALEKEQARVQELQEDLQQQRLFDQQTVEQNHQTQESLHQALNEQASHVSQLNSALEQERITSSNLRSELQIEQSRCEALLAQEHERTELVLSRLEEERSRSAELSDLLSRQAQEHTRRLEEEARRQEAASAHDRKFIQDLRAQLEQERRQGEDLAAMLERLQGQVLEGKRRQAEEAEQETHKEQEEVRRLRAALEGLQTQKTGVGHTLDAERERAARLQTELDVMKEKMRVVKEREKVREEQMERQRKQEQVEKERRQERTNEKLLELEVLRQKDQQRLRQLQQTLADLEQKEKQLASDRLQRDTHSNGLTFGQNALTNIPQDSTSSTPSLMERLLKENTEFSECLAALSEEKISLKHTISCLERDLQSLKRQEQVNSPAVTEQCMLSEKLAWQKEKATLQAALRKAETELSKVTASNENRPNYDLSNNKVQRLYERYLRAESYRKSLVYQKRYLLLLLGGFQECEQATLALIARMGAQPTLSQSQVSRPLNRFRTSVRVVIAISRLKFLTRKWQRATRKISVGSATVNGRGTEPSTVPALRTEVLRPQQTGVAFNSPPTRDHALAQRGVASSLVPPIKSPFRLNHRMYTSPVMGPAERSFSSTQDQERSLTEYIQHLETVQQRLGAGCPGSPSMLPYARKSDR
ncbi:A-kinase anchor protein 9-like [Sinocyclocheilus rhinocerous]|uniref:A-kinase anchor protein 9-like n=1 Tax=Sinocyclocheilus rhinocerous TaxID=307959 RepID=UPI0007B79646|nr:PREDICTED: A-kinase anchor protein 9-like [Sinocyclocheilus rhinocerous]